MTTSPLEELLAVVKIPEIWSRLGLPGVPGKSCCSPFRQDRRPSFSVYDGGRKWRDHTTGEGGDAIDFIQCALRCSASDAAKWLLSEYANTTPSHGSACTPDRSQGRRPRIPPLESGPYGNLLILQHFRGLPMTVGLEILIERGLLGFADMKDGEETVRCWLVVDPSGQNAQARRLDGRPWQFLDGNPKAKTLPGCSASWPIGAGDRAERDVLLICEGGPDLLALATVLWLERCEAGDVDRYGLWTMTGASFTIPEAALPQAFAKPCRIYAHKDEAGDRAALRWAEQLHAAGAAAVSIWNSDTKGEDLNDYVSRCCRLPDGENAPPDPFPEPLIPQKRKTPGSKPGALQKLQQIDQCHQ